MRIQFIRQHLLFPPGKIVDTLGDGLCRTLIERGIAKPVDAEDVPNKMIASPAQSKEPNGGDAIHTKPARRGKHK